MDKNLVIENIKKRFGFESLTPMQTQVADCNADTLILISPTGSGKTIAFAVSILKRLDAPGHGVQAVVIAPSRELVLQIYEVIRPIASGYKTVPLYGGHSMQDEVKSLSVIPDIVIATPGRLLDHIERRQLDLGGVSVLVIDEYDKALELGFADEMKKCVKAMDRPRYVVLTSATELKEEPSYLDLSRAERIVAQGSAGPRGRIQTVHIESPARDKLDILVDLLRSMDDGKVIVFVNHRESAERVWSYLRDAGLPAGLYHGGIDQQQREQAVDLLNNGTTPILVSTDLGSRGLDIDSVQSVIHYHMPLSSESMTHRNGRTARMGASGTVYYITSEGDDVPEYVVWDREYMPSGASSDPIRPHSATLYFGSGKKEKISRGDIAGYLIANGGLSPDEVGKIVVRDHNSLAAVPAGKVDGVMAAISGAPLKGKKVRVSLLTGGEPPKAAKPQLPRERSSASSAGRRAGAAKSGGSGKEASYGNPRGAGKSPQNSRSVAPRGGNRPSGRRGGSLGRQRKG